MEITQSEYYRQQGLHPDQIAVEDASVFSRHYSIRKNLYQHLHLPLSLISGKDVLEVGCGTGESALVLALYGARLTLIDADPTVASRLDALFETFGVAERIRRKAFCSFEEYADDPIFSLVTAEGFLFLLSNRDAMLRKICSLIQPGGFGIVSFPDRFGSFFEFLKKAIMWRAYQIEDIQDIYCQSALDIARQLFKKSFDRLPHAREFATWWKDCMVSPFLTWDDCWAYDEMLELLSEERCAYYSSIPRVYESSHLTQYKAIQSSAERKTAVLRSYAARKFDFLFGDPVGVSPEAPRLKELSEAIGKILKSLSIYFRSLSEPSPVIDFKPIARLFAEMGVEHELIPELAEFFTLMHIQSVTELIDGYAGLRRLSQSWGSSYHYLCFTKEAEIL